VSTFVTQFLLIIFCYEEWVYFKIQSSCQQKRDPFYLAWLLRAPLWNWELHLIENRTLLSYFVTKSTPSKWEVHLTKNKTLDVASTDTTPRHGILDYSFFIGLVADAISSCIGLVMDAMFWQNANLFINWQNQARWMKSLEKWAIKPYWNSLSHSIHDSPRNKS